MNIALFSHLVACGAHETVYILDGLIQNGTDIKPNTIDDDTQLQRGRMFGVSHLVGIDLARCIRYAKDRAGYKTVERCKDEHIGSWCRQAIDTLTVPLL